MIGTYAETELHAALKRHYAGSDGEIEVRVGPYWIDVRRQARLIEIQTGNFSALRAKLARLLTEHDVSLVYPVAAERHLLWLDPQGAVVRRRKSPMRGRVEDIFDELVSFPQLIGHPRLQLRVLMTHEELLRTPAPRRKRFDRGWTPVDRRLVGIVGEHVFTGPDDFVALLPSTLLSPFTARELASCANLSLRTAQRMVYCLRKMNALEEIGRRGRASTYARRSSDFSITQPSSPSA
jgi:hypothetical protein